MNKQRGKRLKEETRAALETQQIQGRKLQEILQPNLLIFQSWRLRPSHAGRLAHSLSVSREEGRAEPSTEPYRGPRPRLLPPVSLEQIDARAEVEWQGSQKERPLG